MAEDIVVRYRAEVDDLLKKLDQISDAQKEVVDSNIKANNEAKKSATTQEFAAKKRAQLLELEKKRLLELRKAQSLAFDPKLIQDFNNKIRESSTNIELLTNKTNKQTSVLGGGIKSFALGAGAALAAAFSVDAIVNFGKAAVNGFLEAEKASERLKFAIVTLGGNSEAAFEKLEKQAERLENALAIDADNIKEAQGALAAFGLTADEIERAIPKLADFATVTGVDIVQAAQQVGAGLEGAGREFKKYGIEVSATASRQDNLNNILGGFGKFAGAAENATKTLSGTLEQTRLRSEALKDEIGERLAPAFTRARVAVLEYIQALLLIPAAQARKATEEQRDELQKQNIDFAVATAQRIQNLDKIAAAQQLLADKEKQLDDLRSLRVNNLDAQNQRKEEIKIIQEIIDLEEKRIQSESDASALSLANAERTLTADKIRLLSVKELNQLLIDNKKINDDIAKANISLLNQEIDARKKLTEAAAAQLRQLQIENIQDERVQREIQFQDEVNAIQVQGKLRNELIKELRVKLNRDLQVLDEKQTQAERDEAKKRDQIVLDTIEFERLAKQKIADEEAARASQALEIGRTEDIEGLLEIKRQAESIKNKKKRKEALDEELSLRKAYSKSFREETLKDLDVEINAIRAKEGFTVDANNKIVILRQEAADKIKKIDNQLLLDTKDNNEKRLEDEKVTLSQILQETAALVGQITSIYNDYTNARIDDINRIKEANLESLNQQLDENETALERRQISDADYENNRSRLLLQRQQAEATAAKKERELRKKQAQLNKTAAIAQATINTALAVTAALTAGPVIGVVLAALAAALGAVEIGVIASTPIPYAKGTKSAKKGLARVGEQGEEIMYVPGGTKVLPNKQTNRYGEVLDSMFDNRFDQLYIKRKDIAPQIIKQKQIKEVNTQKSFAENIAQSAMINPATGLTYFDMEALRKKGQYIKNVDELAKAIANEMPKFNPYRQ